MSHPTDETAIPLHVLDPDALAVWLNQATPSARAWVSANGFEASSGNILCIPGDDGSVSEVLFGWGAPSASKRERFRLSRAAEVLPRGLYELAPSDADFDATLETLGWSLAGYRFSRYNGKEPPEARLNCPEGVDPGRLKIITDAAALTQDQINTPARDMAPGDLEDAFTALATACDATHSVIRGTQTLEDANFPMIAAVGAAAADEPRLLDMSWGREDAPKVTIVGKGVCFDTGGLNIKPGASMGLMKKDMGGAATALGLAQMIMKLGIDIRLRVLIPAVENAISAPAMRPGDILTSRKGLSVEINNTDAEGRLVLADALALADEESPEILISLATLTGAARVALGPDVPPFFTDDETLAAELSGSSVKVADPLWRLPFWDPYENMIEPGIADLDNAPAGGMAGSITAALFLRRFTEKTAAYLHVDIFGWTPVAKPARAKGGAFQAARAISDMLEARFGTT